jgi:hypothetical protein
MILDTSFFEPLYQAEQKKTYKELGDYLISLEFDELFYKQMGIYYETHFYKNKQLAVSLPIGFLLNYYYGKENNNKEAILNALNTLSKNEAAPLKSIFFRELSDCLNFLNKNPILKTYEEKYGKQKSKIIKEKISFSMKNLDKNIILKRNNSIKKYASNRPDNHNKNISLARKQKIIDINTKKIYNCINEVIEETKICKTYIRLACQGKRKLQNYDFHYLKTYEEFMEKFI